MMACVMELEERIFFWYKIIVPFLLQSCENGTELS